MKVVAILQARMHSTRLPGKMLLPLAGVPLVQRVIERVQRAKLLNETVLAIPLRDWPAFRHLQNSVEIYCYPGPEDDLVARYLCAAECYGADLIVRIPCDNPCVQGEYIDQAITEYLDATYVFYSNTTELVSLPDKKPTKYTSGKSARWVDGIGCEVFSMSRLKWLEAKTNGQPQYREHPHKLFYDIQNDDDLEGYTGIHVNQIDPEDLLRLDVNTQADYDFISDIYNALYPTNPQFTITDILSYLDNKTVTA